jgi:hypothetical protein
MSMVPLSAAASCIRCSLLLNCGSADWALLFCLQPHRLCPNLLLSIPAHYCGIVMHACTNLFTLQACFCGLFPYLMVASASVPACSATSRHCGIVLTTAQLNLLHNLPFSIPCIHTCMCQILSLCRCMAFLRVVQARIFQQFLSQT